MSKSKKKPIIGILGGVGAGKSTVAAEFGKLGCAVIDADKIAHGLVNKSTVKKKMVARFGKGILTPRGKINRRKLAGAAFAGARNLKALNRIIHPLVLQQVRELIRKAKGQKKVKAVVLDMPLLTEVGWAKQCDKLIFVKCSWKIRAERAKKAGFLNLEKLKFREKFQISLYKKRAIADNTIDNNSGLSVLARQVADIFSIYDLGKQGLPRK